MGLAAGTERHGFGYRRSLAARDDRRVTGFILHERAWRARQRLRSALKESVVMRRRWVRPGTRRRGQPRARVQAPIRGLITPFADRLLPLSLSALAFVFLPMRLRGQSSWTEYQPGSLSGILVRERSWASAHTHGLQEVTIVSGVRLGLRARVIYSGQSQPVSSAHREVSR